MPPVFGSGRKPDPKPKEPLPESNPEIDRQLSTLESLIAHRLIGLLDLGFSLEQSLRLTARPDVVHDAGDLLARGAPHSFVVEELAP